MFYFICLKILFIQSLNLGYLYEILLSLFSGCVTTSHQLSLNEQEYLQNVMATPLEFLMPVEKGDEAWGRAQFFISKYSSMKLQIATDYVLETYSPQEYEASYAYKASRVKEDDEYRFLVQCVCGFTWFSYPKRVERNVHIFAYYIKTGKLNEKFIWLS